MQSASKDKSIAQKPTVLNTLSKIYRENGMKGLYRGVTPRIGLGVWQTVCMVSFADYVKIWYVFMSPVLSFLNWLGLLLTSPCLQGEKRAKEVNH